MASSNLICMTILIFTGRATHYPHSSASPSYIYCTCQGTDQPRHTMTGITSFRKADLHLYLRAASKDWQQNLRVFIPNDALFGTGTISISRNSHIVRNLASHLRSRLAEDRQKADPFFKQSGLPWQYHKRKDPVAEKEVVKRRGISRDKLELWAQAWCR